MPRSNKSRASGRYRAGGFTLLEIILALGLLTILLAAVFGVVGGTSELASSVQQRLDKDAAAHSFAQFCDRLLRGLDGHAAVRLRVKQSGRRYLSELALKNAPAVLGAAGGGAGLTMLSTEEAPDGYLRVVLSLLNEDEAQARELGKGEAVPRRLILLENVARCEWRFFNWRSNEWEPVWNDKVNFTFANASSNLKVDAANPATGNPPPGAADPGAPPQQPPPQLIGSGDSGMRPGLIELTLVIGTDPPRRLVFWVPPAQIPTASPDANPNPNSPNPPGSPQPAPNPGTPGANGGFTIKPPVR